MLSERILSRLIHTMTKQHLALNPTSETMMPSANPGQKYMLYMHVPFCERLCPYCSFNRYPFREEVARPYFANMRKEMLMLKDLGYDFESIYVGGGTPTVMIDELCETLDMARDNFNIREVASETNPNHLTQPWLDKLQGRVQRLSVGVQSFDDDLLKQMDRYEKYGSGDVILERIAEAEPYFDSLNVDMIFNFPSQTEDVLMADLEKIVPVSYTHLVDDELARQPQGERMQARERLGVAHGIAEGKRLTHEHDLAQHRVRQTRRAHREGAHELHALVDGRVRRLAEEDDLVGAHSQGIAHVGFHVAGRVERAIDDLVERARGADHAESQLRSERAILRREVGAVDARADDVLRERIALAHGAHHVERGQTCGARLRARLLRGVFRSGVALGLSRLTCFRHGVPPRSGRRP